MKWFISILFFAFVWEACARLGFLDLVFFPSPSAIIKNTFFIFQHESFALQMYHSFKRLFWAVALSLPLAFCVAFWVTHSKIGDYLISPLIALTYPLPKVAIYPLLLLLLGIDEFSKIVLISIGMFYLFFVNIRVGIIKVKKSHYFNILKIYNVDKIDYFLSYIVKGIRPEFLTGLKLGINYGLTLVVVSEMSTSNNGIGYFIWRSWDQFKIINVYSGILILAISGAVLYFFFNSMILKLKERYL